MQKSFKRLVLTVLVIMLVSTVFGQISTDSINAIISREVTAKRSKSIIVGIVDSTGRRQIFAAGVISDKNQRPPDENTIYEIGSITKVFTSLLLADMSVKHELDVNDPASKFLPKTVKVPARNGKEITLLSLSTNRSGLPRNAGNIDAKNLDNPFADYTRKQLYEFLSAYELGRDVDAKWHYSNIGYSLLGDVITIVGQKDYETLVEERICKPLKMNGTFLSPPRKLKYKIAQGYSECGQPASAWNFLLPGGGGLRSNVKDMLNFAEANLGLVKAEIYPAMEMTHILRAKKDGNDTYTTMGWTLSNDDGKYILFKDGGTGGYRTFLGIDKVTKIGVVVLSNSNNSVTDIGWHILDSNRKPEPYKYPWGLLDTIRIVAGTKGVDAAIELYQQLKASKNRIFVFNEAQLNYLGNELRRDKKIKDAIKIHELNTKEYPQSALVYESLGETHRRNKNRKAAIECFEKAYELEPQNPRWFYMLEMLKSG